MLPIIFDLPFFTLFSYPLFMGISWGFGFFFTKSLFDFYELDSKKLNLLFVGIFLSSWIGAKLFFLYFSSGPKVYQYIYANYFWLGGGFVFYGGLIFGLIFYLIWAKLLKKFDINNSAYLLPGLVFGHSIGRIGCLLAGCCYGSIANNGFGIKIQNEYRYPVQAFESLILIFIGISILYLLKKRINKKLIILFYLISYSIARFILEYFRGDEIRGVLLSNLSTSQIISIVIFTASIIYLIINLSQIRNKFWESCQ